MRHATDSNVSFPHTIVAVDLQRRTCVTPPRPASWVPAACRSARTAPGGAARLSGGRGLLDPVRVVQVVDSAPHALLGADERPSREPEHQPRRLTVTGPCSRKGPIEAACNAVVGSERQEPSEQEAGAAASERPVRAGDPDSSCDTDRDKRDPEAGELLES
jgi:hypothetical protein